MRAAKPPGLQLDQHLLRKLKEQALAKARRLQEEVRHHLFLDLPSCSLSDAVCMERQHGAEHGETHAWAVFADGSSVPTGLQASKSTADNLAHAKMAAQDLAASRNATEAGAKVLTLWRSAETAPLVVALARFLVRANPLYVTPWLHGRTMHACWLRLRTHVWLSFRTVLIPLPMNVVTNPSRDACSSSVRLAVAVRADLHVLREPGGGGLPALGALPDARAGRAPPDLPAPLPARPCALCPLCARSLTCNG